MAKKKSLKRSIEQAADQTTGKRHKRSKKILGLDLGSIGKVVATAVIAEIANTALRKASQPSEDTEFSTESKPGDAPSNSSNYSAHSQQASSSPLRGAVPDRAAVSPEQSQPRPPQDAEPNSDLEAEENQPGWVNPLLTGVQPVLAEVAPLLGQTVAQSIATIGQRAMRPQAVGEAGAQAAAQTGAAVSQAGELSEQAIETISAAVQRALEQALSGVAVAKQAVADHLPSPGQMPSPDQLPLADHLPSTNQTAEALPSKKTKKAKGKKKRKKK